MKPPPFVSVLLSVILRLAVGLSNLASRYASLGCAMLAATLIGLSGGALAQQTSFGTTFISNSGQAAVYGAHSFDDGSPAALPGLIGTARDGTAGLFIFVDGSSHSGANDAKHVDGYVQYMGSSGTFIYPVGDNGVFKPAATTGAGATVSYFNANPSTAITSNLAGGNYGILPSGGVFNSASKAPDVFAVSTTEYWDINGASATRISLTWTAGSNVAALTSNSLNKLTIVGWNAATSRWEKIASTVDTTSLLGGASSLSAGSITTDTAVVPNTYNVYTLAQIQLPSLIRVNKDINGRIDAADQFVTEVRTGVTLGSANSTGTVISSTSADPLTGGGVVTSGTGTSFNTGTGQLAVYGTTSTYTITENKTAGTGALTNYASTIICSNAKAGSPTVIPTTAVAFTAAAGLNIVNPQPEDDITCTITNNGTPKITIAKQTRGGVGTFNLTGTNGFVASSVTTSAEIQAVQASNPGQNLAASNVDTVITEAMPAGWRIESVSCIDNNAANTGNPTGAVIGSVTSTNQFTIAAVHAKPGADLSCALINTFEQVLFTVSGKVFLDTGVGAGGVANDGLINGSEEGLAAINISLTDCASTTLASTTSSSDGSYSLGVPVGTPAGNLCVVQAPSTTNLGTLGGVGVAGSSYTRSTLTVQLPYANATIANVNLGNVTQSRLISDNTVTGAAGSTASLPHTFIAGTAGSVALSVINPVMAPSATGWSEVFYQDNNCDALLDAADVALGATATLSVTAGQQVCLIVQQSIPAGLGDGANRQVQVQAVHTWANLVSVSETLTRQDITLVGATSLQLIKEVRNVTTDALLLPAGTEVWSTSNKAKPGHTLEYRIRFTNMSTQAMDNLSINDSTPSYTTFVSASCPVTPPLGMTCAVPSNAAVPTPTAPAVGASGSIRWIFTGALAPAASGVVMYRVLLN